MPYIQTSGAGSGYIQVSAGNYVQVDDAVIGSVDLQVEPNVRPVVGDTLRFVATFIAIDGTLVDPTAVTFKQREPSGLEASFVYGVDASVSRSDVGIYSFDKAITATGDQYVRVVSSGNIATAKEALLRVPASRFTAP